jgi:hypothetical protein
MALESEINRWSGFAVALRKPDLEAFEEMMDSSRKNAIAAGNASNPIIFEHLVMSILIAQHARTEQLEKDWQTMNPKLVNPSKSHELNNEQTLLKTNVQKTSGGGGQQRLR